MIGSEGSPIEVAKYVPPPAPLIRDLLQDLEEFVSFDSKLPLLVQGALMHYQFEFIHPYMDGNGRIGCLLIVLFLWVNRILPQPLLYLSADLETDRETYYDKLFRMSAHGDWETWLDYFLRGVAE